MKLIAAPMRQFKTWSMLLLMAAGIFDLAVVLLKTLSDLHVMSTETFGAINAVLVFLIGAARFVHQQIEMTTTQKVAAIKSVAAQPVKEGEAEVQAAVRRIPKAT